MNLSRKLTSSVAAVALAAAGLAALNPPTAGAAPGSTGCDNRTNGSLTKLLNCVSADGVLQHLEALQDIADANGGNRAAGSSGDDATVAYLKQKLTKAGYSVREQEFEFRAWRTVGASVMQQLDPADVTYTEGVDFVPTTQSEPGDVTADVTPVDVALGLGNASTSGCEPADFVGFTAGNIALLQRGLCTFEQKAENAAAAGASAVLFFNQGNTPAPDRNGIPAVTLGSTNDAPIPAISTTYALGAQFATTPGLRMRLFGNVEREFTTTSNVIAESRFGDPSNVVMAGAHHDSVPEGAGINDNGSGSAALLEVAEQLGKVRTKNQLRFAWWGAEEASLVGSNHYVSDLLANAPADLAKIEMYLNFDMVASPNYGLFRYDGDGSDFGLVGPNGSDEIEAVFTRFYTDVREVPTESSPFNGRSDYQAFINNGIPAGGLFTGAEGVKTPAQQAKWGGTAGIAYDPCYHSACDGIDNVNTTALDINSDAIAYAVYLFATGGEVLND